MTARYSFPRERVLVLLLEGVHPDAAALFSDAGYPVETLAGALPEAELAERLREVHVLGVRSKTQLTPAVLAGADRLLTVGAFCIGTDGIDLPACAERGVAVFNAPYSNTRSVVEMAVGLAIMLLRGVFPKAVGMREGRWDKSAADSREVRGKTLGVVGYGAIGSQLSVVAEALGMSVIYHDLRETLAMGNARKARSLDELLGTSDVVSLHVDGRPENRDLINADALRRMKPRAVLLNLSRGQVVDLAALEAALRGGRLLGAALDVFPEEPRSSDEPFRSGLAELPNVILTPHVGGSTEEAQAAIGVFAAERMLGFLHRGETMMSVNLPNVALAEVSNAHRLLHVHRNAPGVLARINAVLADSGANILAQHLKTDERVGYVITDLDRDYNPELAAGLKAVPGTLKLRTLY